MDIVRKIKRGDYESKYPPVDLPDSVLAHAPEELMEAYDRIAQERQADLKRLEAQFKRDSLASVGMLNHPQADAWYELAWSLTKVYNEINVPARLAFLNTLQRFAELLVE
jgi:hypothetical protein